MFSEYVRKKGCVYHNPFLCAKAGFDHLESRVRSFEKQNSGIWKAGFGCLECTIRAVNQKKIEQNDADFMRFSEEFVQIDEE